MYHTAAVPKILLLGGTGEGSALLRVLQERFNTQLQVIMSLANVKAALPQQAYGAWRTGPFGTVEDVIAYLREQRITAVLSATHPFAATIAYNVSLACKIYGVLHLTLRRPPWICTDEDNWIEVGDMAEAVRKLPRIGKRAFLTIGTKSLSPFLTLKNIWFLIRLPLATVLPFTRNMPHHQIVFGRGQENNDLLLMQTHAIDVLVTKASGGDATKNKILAARTLSLPVLMIRRPSVPESDLTVFSVTEAVAWVDSIIYQLRLRNNTP